MKRGYPRNTKHRLGSFLQDTACAVTGMTTWCFGERGLTCWGQRSPRAGAAALGAGDPLQLTSVGKDPAAGERATTYFFSKALHFMGHPDLLRMRSVEKKGLCLAWRGWSSGKFHFQGEAPDSTRGRTQGVSPLSFSSFQVHPWHCHLALPCRLLQSLWG